MKPTPAPATLFPIRPKRFRAKAHIPDSRQRAGARRYQPRAFRTAAPGANITKAQTKALSTFAT